jgi:hypothetical protein
VTAHFRSDVAIAARNPPINDQTTRHCDGALAVKHMSQKGLTGAPDESGQRRRERGLAKAGNDWPAKGAGDALDDAAGAAEGEMELAR